LRLEYYRIEYLSTGCFSGLPCSVLRLSGCPYSCFYCAGVGEVSRTTAESLAEQFREGAALVDAVVVGGCEPLMQRGTLRLLELLHGDGLRIKLCTSGHRPGALEKVVASELVEEVELCLRGPLDSEGYFRVTGCEEAVDRVFESLEVLSSWRGHSRVTAILAPPHFAVQDLREVLHMVRRLGIENTGAVHWWDASHPGVAPALGEAAPVQRAVPWEVV